MKYYNRSNFEKEKMNIVAELQEMESDKVMVSYWYCPNCKIELDGCHVTYEEKCEYCGSDVLSVPETISQEELDELIKAKADGRLVVLKASISQDVWFYDGANRLMQGKVLEYLNCGNGLIYQVQGTKKGLWLHECEIFLTREAAESVYTEAQIGEIIADFHKAVTNERR